MKNRWHESGRVRISGKPVRAVALLSGGLDSTLAAAVVKAQGIEVIGLRIRHLFDGGERRLSDVQRAVEQVGIRLRLLDLTEEQLEKVRNPRHGRGAGMNPCVDCRMLLLRAAKRVMKEEGAQFVITGEVLGQRPMSQHRGALEIVAEESGLGDRLFRPLSAALLPETLPVREGWIRLEELPTISGRGRKDQTALAERFGIVDYPQPAGGCLLAEKVYAARLRDAFAHSDRERMDVADFRLLGTGRHFRISERGKAIVGRNEEENRLLAELASDRTRLEPLDVMGPDSLVEGDPTEEEIRLIASLAGRYCDVLGGTRIRMRVITPIAERVLEVVPLAPDDPRIAAWRIGAAS